MNMDKMQRRANTAPININVGMSKQARLLQELDFAETLIRATKARISERAEHEKTKYTIAVNLGPQTTTGTKVAHAVCSILAEWNWENEAPKLFHALHLIRKLWAAIESGVPLRESSDVELAFVRKVMSGITT
jgi:hypothetical protein